jgi:hypothetical protein
MTTMTQETTYNGWKNYETWNVALWIQNDEGLYTMAREYQTYDQFRIELREAFGNHETPDGVAWNDSGLDIEALDEMIQELSA